MADGDERPPLIQPPPGLLPAAKPRSDDPEVVNTGSSTRKIRREEAPVFFPATNGIPTPTTTARPSDAADRTVAAHGTVIIWNLQLPDGSWHDVGEEGTVVGRNPAPPESSAEAQTISLDDPQRSVSKTHAIFTVEKGTLLVEDLASTNGVTIAVAERSSRIAVHHPEPVPDGAIVGLGSFAVRVRRGRKLA